VHRAVRNASTAAAGGTRRQVLDAIVRQPGVSPGDLARRLGINPATVTHHVKALGAAGLVQSSRMGAGVRLIPTGLGADTMVATGGAA
jgi:DNA-binding MarR family transcriptional regulator